MLRYSRVIRSKITLKYMDHYHNANIVKSDESDVHLRRSKSSRNNQVVSEIKMINFEIW